MNSTTDSFDFSVIMSNDLTYDLPISQAELQQKLRARDTNNNKEKNATTNSGLYCENLSTSIDGHDATTLPAPADRPHVQEFYTKVPSKDLNTESAEISRFPTKNDVYLVKSFSIDDLNQKCPQLKPKRVGSMPPKIISPTTLTDSQQTTPEKRQKKIDDRQIENQNEANIVPLPPVAGTSQDIETTLLPTDQDSGKQFWNLLSPTDKRKECTPMQALRRKYKTRSSQEKKE